MTTYYHLHQDVRLSDLAGEGVALHLGERRYFTVNGTGLTILQALEAPQSFEDLVAVILREYEIDQDTAEQTTRQFLTQCLDAKVIWTDPS